MGGGPVSGAVVERGEAWTAAAAPFTVENSWLTAKIKTLTVESAPTAVFPLVCTAVCRGVAAG